jgi:phosphoglycolate phosphatase
MPSALFFDLDGTLTDPYEGISASLRHGMAAVGKPLAQDADLRWCIGPPLQGSIAKLLGPDADALEGAVLEHYRERFKAQGMFENKVYPGIPETLAGLGSRYRLLVATSKPRVFAERILEHFQLRAHFAAVYGSELDGTRSKKAELLAWALQQESLRASDTLMIGDRAEDMLGANANGISAVGVLWGYGDEGELRSAGAAKVLGKPRDLTQL